MAEKKIAQFDIGIKRSLVENNHKTLTISKQCNLLQLSKSTLYYQARPEGPKNLEIMQQIDQIYTANPEYGSRRIKFKLNRLGYPVGRDLIRTLMQRMGIEAIYPKANLSKVHPEHKIYPYLLRGVKIERPDHVWSTDITYIGLKNGFFYLTAVIDWYSRYVLSWKLSNSLDGIFCEEVLLEALKKGKPRIFNTDQGTQYTSKNFQKILKDQGIQPSMDGRGRALDNIFIERLWRSVKYENIFIQDYQDGLELFCGLNNYFNHYNKNRPHTSLSYKYPYEVYRKK